MGVFVWATIIFYIFYHAYRFIFAYIFESSPTNSSIPIALIVWAEFSSKFWWLYIRKSFTKTCKWDIPIRFHSQFYMLSLSISGFLRKLFYWWRFLSLFLCELCLFIEVFPITPNICRCINHMHSPTNPVLLFTLCQVRFLLLLLLYLFKVFRLIFVDRLAGTAAYARIFFKYILQTKHYEGGINEIETRFKPFFSEREKKGKSRKKESHNIKWIINATIENVNGELFPTVVPVQQHIYCMYIYYFLLDNVRFAHEYL